MDRSVFYRPIELDGIDRQRTWICQDGTASIFKGIYPLFV